MRFLLGAFGDPGHAFPMLALARALALRGHDVTLETWRRWQAHVEAAGVAFAPAPEYQVFPTREHPLRPYQVVARATTVTRPRIAELRPDAVVADILTLAPALAAELEGVPVATLIPHVHPAGAPGFAPYALGARLPRTAAGRALWRALELPVGAGLRRGRDELNETRARLGLAPQRRWHGGISDELCLVGTFPALEYPRRWAPEARVVGPLLWEPPAEEVELPPGDEPLVLVAPSTSQDPDHRLLRATLKGLAGESVRVLATTNRRAPPAPIEVPRNAVLVDWVSYARTMPHAALVVCHGGHGTVARALACGCPILACPAAGDMGENAARLDWAGLGVRVPWRWASPIALRLAVRRALRDDGLAIRAGAVARWASTHDGARQAAKEVERFAAGSGQAVGCSPARRSRR